MTRRLVIVALLLVAVAFSGCATRASTQEPESPSPAPSESPAAGTQLAPGLYDLEGGKAQALGTLEWKDLEGGFWVITGGTEAEGDVGKTVAVIANRADFETKFESLKGKQVVAVGTKVDGASVRMAGPEIEIESIEEVAATSGPAD